MYRYSERTLNMICPRCHTSNPAGRIVCYTCGAPEAVSLATTVTWLADSPDDISRKFEHTTPLGPGRLLAARYELVELIGEGGMGVVYKAKDLRLGRLIALKVLTINGTPEPEQKARFIREARAAAGLDHPNICTCYEIDESDGHTFIATAYLKGRSLKDRALTAEIPIPEAVDLIVQAAEGLAHAHAQGVVHRDIKPGNLFITSEGVLKIIDFGLALVAGEATLTEGRTRIGTASYMSPEQVNAHKIDHRTDLWSLGVVLYEILAGQRPFDGSNYMSTMFAILHRDFKPLSSLRKAVSPELEKVVSRALAKSPEDRYPDMHAFLQDLCSLRDWAPTVTVTRGGAHSAGRIPSIAVLPFVDMSSARDQEFFCEGIAEDIINALMQVKGLHVVSRGSSFRFSGKSYDLAEVAQKLRVATVLEGSVRKHENRHRITAHLIDAGTGDKLWARRFDLEMKDVFAVQDEISLAIASALKVTLLESQQEGLVKRYTQDMDAYAAYLKGRHSWSKRTSDAVGKAVEFYQEALRNDPEYALAHAGLADAYILPGYYGTAPAREVMPRGKQAALRALEVDPNLAEGRTSLGAISSIYEHDWKDAEYQFTLAHQSNPNYATAHSWYGLFTLIPQGRFDECLVHAKIAQRLDPLTPFVNTIVGMSHYFRRDYDAATKELRRVINLEPAFPTAHLYLGRSLWDSHHQEEAIESFRIACALYPKNAMFAAHLAYATSRAGGTGDALRLLADLKTQSATSYVPASSLAILELGIGNKTAAMELLEEANEQRDLYSIWLAVDPLYDDIRNEPRFSSLVRKMLESAV